MADACRLEQILEESDWFEYENLGKLVLIVSTGAGGRRSTTPAATAAFRSSAAAVTITAKAHRLRLPSARLALRHARREYAIYGKQLFSERQLKGAGLSLMSCSDVRVADRGEK